MLTALSPLDGRYQRQTAPLAAYFSESALIRYRVRVEIEYFIALCELPLPQLAGVPTPVFSQLRTLYLDFTPAAAEAVKAHEAVTNHDVKAVGVLPARRICAPRPGRVRRVYSLRPDLAGYQTIRPFR